MVFVVVSAVESAVSVVLEAQAANVSSIMAARMSAMIFFIIQSPFCDEVMLVCGLSVLFTVGTPSFGGFHKLLHKNSSLEKQKILSQQYCWDRM